MSIFGISTVKAWGLDLGPKSQIGGSDFKAFSRVRFVVCDWNNDGYKDLVIGGEYAGRIYIYSGKKDGSFNRAQFLKVNGKIIREEFGFSANPYVVDWNNDGKKDVLIGFMKGKIRVFLNSGSDNNPEFNDGNFTNIGLFAQGTPIQAGGKEIGEAVKTHHAHLVVVDWNQDGKKDFLVGRYSDGKAILFLDEGEDSNPKFAEGIPLQLKEGVDIQVSWGLIPEVVDWDNDGDLDLLAGGTSGGGGAGQVQLFLNSGTRAAPEFSIMDSQVLEDSKGKIRIPGKWAAPEVTDWDDDGKKDLLIGDFYGNILFYQNGGTDKEPKFTISQLITGPDFKTGYNFISPAVVDWEGDGDLDLVYGNWDKNLWLALNSGDASKPFFMPSKVIVAGKSQKLRLGIVDFDNDDDFDIITGQGGGVTVWVNSGTRNSPVFSKGIGLSAGDKLINIGGDATPFMVDWDNDGKEDLLTGNRKGNVTLFTGTDNLVSFKEGIPLQAQGTPVSVHSFAWPCVADWNSDGKKDLLVGTGQGKVYLYLNQGPDNSSVLGKGMPLTSGGMEIDVGSRAAPIICDWNKDGVLDLLIGALDGNLYYYEGKK